MLDNIFACEVQRMPTVRQLPLAHHLIAVAEPTRRRLILTTRCQPLVVFPDEMAVLSRISCFSSFHVVSAFFLRMSCLSCSHVVSAVTSTLVRHRPPTLTLTAAIKN